MDKKTINFGGAPVKLTIGSLDEPGEAMTVRAQYNPKDLQLTKQVSWKSHNEGDLKVKRGSAPSASKQDSMEMTGAPTRAMQIELLFDGVEEGKSVEERVRILDKLSSPRVPASPDPVLRRPHYCAVVWGQEGIPPFRCIIDQLQVKYTVFDGNGVPLRATCTVSVKEAELKLTLGDAQAVVGGIVGGLARALGSVRDALTPRLTPAERAAALGPTKKPPVAAAGPGGWKPSKKTEDEVLQMAREVNGDAPKPPPITKPTDAELAEVDDAFKRGASGEEIDGIVDQQALRRQQQGIVEDPTKAEVDEVVDAIGEGKSEAEVDAIRRDQVRRRAEAAKPSEAATPIGPELPPGAKPLPPLTKMTPGEEAEVEAAFKRNASGEELAALADEHQRRRADPGYLAKPTPAETQEYFEATEAHKSKDELEALRVDQVRRRQAAAAASLEPKKSNVSPEVEKSMAKPASEWTDEDLDNILE